MHEVDGLARDRRTAILCAEEDPGRCHRRLLIAPALRVKDVRVVHIRSDGRVEDDPPSDVAPQLPLFE